MILDSSAIVAVVLREPGCEGIVSKLATAKALAVGAPTLAETGIAACCGDCFGSGAETVFFGEEHWREAGAAYARFGRGRHKAGLNFGDCMAYAVAKLAGEPLLSTGDDFPKTDLPLA